MAIGPDASRSASGRIVVIAVSFFIQGSIAAVLGLGPLVQPTAPIAQAAGIASIGAGGVMLIGGTALLMRGRFARAFGYLAAAGTVVIGGLLVAVAVVSIIDCGESGAIQSACEVVGVGVAVIGLLIVAMAIAAAMVIRRTRPAFLRRPPRR